LRKWGTKVDNHCVFSVPFAVLKSSLYLAQRTQYSQVKLSIYLSYVKQLLLLKLNSCSPRTTLFLLIYLSVLVVISTFEQIEYFWNRWHATAEKASGSTQLE